MRTLALCLLVCTNALAARPWKGGAVAAAQHAASEAGRDVLDQGGNAVDAAVAAAFVMAVVGPYHSGLGGGGFAIIHLTKDGKDLVFDFREVAPAKASHDMFLREGQAVPELSTDGALSVAVPGAVKGYLELQAKYGALSRAKVLAPAIRIAKRGFPVTPKFRDLANLREDCLRKDPDATKLFLRPGKDGVAAAPENGTLITQPDLARTLEALAKNGDKAFYEGPIAKAVVDTVQQAGGVLSLEDLKSYQTRWRTPLEGHYRGHRIVTMPPPSAGGIALLQVLGVIEAHGPKGTASKEVDVLHFALEGLRRAYVDRAKYLGDPAFTAIPLEKLTSAAYLAELTRSIDPKKATPSASLLPAELKAPPKKENKNTTHVSVIDAQGNAVALTTTVNYSFGSCLVAKGTGVVLNDEMDDFAAQPGLPNVYGLVTGEANSVAPGKIPLSSMTPTLVFQKDRPAEVMLAVGSPGGSTIPTTVLQVISNIVDGGLDVVRAVGAGRVHHQWLPDEVMVDRNGLEPATAAGLEALGHKLRRTEGWGDAEAVYVDPSTGLHTAASDPRNEGAPAGQD